MAGFPRDVVIPDRRDEPLNRRRSSESTMRLYSRLGPIVLALTTFAALDAAADPIDYTHGMITGADIFGGASQGIPIGTPVWDRIEDKDYTFMVVNSDRDKHESYVGLGPTSDYGFSSALATGDGDLEVGTRNEIRQPGGQRAVTRYNFTIKNNVDQAFTSGLNLHIDKGFMGVKGIRSDHTAHLRLEAVVDYVLLTPAGPFGGTMRKPVDVCSRTSSTSRSITD
jgi:hypothetical protein